MQTVHPHEQCFHRHKMKYGGSDAVKAGFENTGSVDTKVGHPNHTQACDFVFGYTRERVRYRSALRSLNTNKLSARKTEAVRILFSDVGHYIELFTN